MRGRVHSIKAAQYPLQSYEKVGPDLGEKQMRQIFKMDLAILSLSVLHLKNSGFDKDMRCIV